MPAFLAEFAGACLLGVAPSFQRFVVLYGDGGTGKSAIVRVVSGVMPEGSVGSIPPHEWQREYYRARLVGVRLNAVSEMPSTEIFETESIKAIQSDLVKTYGSLENISKIGKQVGVDVNNNLKANLQANRFDAIVSYGHANLIRQLVLARMAWTSCRTLSTWAPKIGRAHV